MFTSLAHMARFIEPRLLCTCPQVHGFILSASVYCTAYLNCEIRAIAAQFSATVADGIVQRSSNRSSRHDRSQKGFHKLVRTVQANVQLR